MTDKELYDIVRKALFQTGSCPLNTWYTIVVNGNPMFEAAINKRGFIHIRKPIKRVQHKDNTFEYKKWKFNSKKELIYDGIWEGTRPDAKNNKEVRL